MATIRVIRVRGRFNKGNPRVVYFHRDNFDKATTRTYSKYNVMTIGQRQYDRYWDNKEKAYRATVRFHKS